jgi:hypothetical protein
MPKFYQFLEQSHEQSLNCTTLHRSRGNWLSSWRRRVWLWGRPLRSSIRPYLRSQTRSWDLNLWCLFFSLHMFVFEILNEILRPEALVSFSLCIGLHLRSKMRSWDLKVVRISDLQWNLETWSIGVFFFSLGACSYLRS